MGIIFTACHTHFYHLGLVFCTLSIVNLCLYISTKNKAYARTCTLIQVSVAHCVTLYDTQLECIRLGIHSSVIHAPRPCLHPYLFSWHSLTELFRGGNIKRKRSVAITATAIAIAVGGSLETWSFHICMIFHWHGHRRRHDMDYRQMAAWPNRDNVAMRGALVLLCTILPFQQCCYYI